MAQAQNFRDTLSGVVYLPILEATEFLTRVSHQ